MSVAQFPKIERGPPDMRGPERMGCDVILDERVIPNLHMHDRGDTIEFILDGRLAYEFPKEWAYLAAAFAANAMAIGAGYPFLGAETRDRPFAPKCYRIDLGEQS